MKKLSSEEMAVGAVVALAWFMITGWWTILIALACGYLWAKGGSEGTSLIVRRLGVPTAICGGAALINWSWIPLVSFLPFFGVLTIGYGIPSWNNPDGSMDDKGSPLGRFWWIKVHGGMTKGTKEEETKTDLLVRGTLAFAYGLTLLSFAWISVLGWMVGLVLITILVPLMVVLVK